jgi:hypothetical protein
MKDRIDNEFAPAKESVDWAEDAIAEFQEAAQGFFQSDVTEIVTEFDPQTRENVQKIRMRRPIPKEFRRRATEALVHTRHAFDQATYAARNVTSGRRKATIYFPWSRSPTDLEHLLESRGIDKRLWDIFATHEPYPRADTHSGGDDIIRTLAVMANDKHTVGLSVGGDITSTGYPSMRGDVVESMTILMPRWDSVKNEAELIRWVGDVKIEGQYNFRFEIVLKDARLPHSVNAVSDLIAFAAKAKSVIESLQGRCVDLRA